MTAMILLALWLLWPWSQGPMPPAARTGLVVELYGSPELVSIERCSGIADKWRMCHFVYVGILSEYRRDYIVVLPEEIQ